MAESKKMVKKEVAFMKAKGAPKSMVKHEKAEVMDTGMKKGGAKPGMGMFGVGARKATAPAAKPTAKKLVPYADLVKKNDAKAAMQAKKSATAAAKPVSKPADLGDDVRTSNPKEVAAYHKANPNTPFAMKKGGKVCGMKAGGVKKDLPTAKDLGSMNMKKGGRVKCMAGGGYVRAADGVTKKGKTKGKII